ncbi:MAG: hypothetical protein H0W73_04285 [Bacteroidetes bacterium]|nr:hypothetical protein [Bacteroidota bacterium]
MKTEKIYTQHDENKEWMNNLLFYRDEIKIMKGRVAEIASKNTSKDRLAQVEHFQNQLLIQRGQIDTLKHAINLDNDSIDKEIKKNAIALEHRSIKDHDTTRENMVAFEKNFSSLKLELNTFLNKRL